MKINERKREIGLECVEALKNTGFYGAALIGTGGGKTWMMLKCMQEIDEFDTLHSILYTCNSIDLRDKDFSDEIKKWGYEKYEENMTKMCYQSACKLKGESYDLLLADEADFAMTPEYVKLFKNNKFKYIIFVSATLTPEKERMVEKLKIPIVYRKALHELENESVLNSSKYFYVNYLLNEDENKKYLEYNRVISGMLKNDTNGGSYDQDELNFVLMQRKLFLNRLKSSAQVCKDLLKKMEGRTVVFSELTSQIDKICKYTYHGKNTEANNLELFHNGDIDVLGACDKINRGQNINRIENIILESCSSSKTKIQQKLGRGKRLEVDDFLNVFMQVPYYQATKFHKNEIRPTIVLKWLETALKDFNIPQIEVFKF